ncbi:MAG: DNA-protecting protein DprA [Ruminococcus sp.]|nr:DNA-protecting protein DprA [Ruminococcus sp.]
MMDVCAYWLWLVMVFGPANPRIWSLSHEYENAESFVEALENDKVKGLTGGEKERISMYEVMDAAIIIDECRSAGYGVYCYESEEYPSKLKLNSNPPAVLFTKGQLDLLNSGLIVNVAGTRSPSSYSVMVTEHLCNALAKRGCIISSGLSEGIDMYANKAAIDLGCPTIGVCGLAIEMYEDDEFIGKITENGLIISETCAALDYPRPKFTDRNRILVSLCDSMIFVEGSIDSKGLKMCDQAIAAGKFLFVVPPHDITDKRYGGQSWLIRRGCRPVFSEADVLYTLAHLDITKLKFDYIGAEYTELSDYSFFADESPVLEDDEVKGPPKKRAASQNKPPKSKTAEVDISSLDDFGKAIYELLKEKPLIADVIASRLGADIADVLSKLTMLEIDGFVVSMPGKQYGAL